MTFLVEKNRKQLTGTGGGAEDDDTYSTLVVRCNELALCRDLPLKKGFSEYHRVLSLLAAQRNFPLMS